MPLFTNGKDHPFVTDKFEETYQKFLETKVFNFDCMGLSASYVSALGAVLKDFTELAELSLQRNDFGAEGAAALAEALRANTSILKVDLGWIDIGAEGAAALAEALETNRVRLQYPA